MEARCRVPRDSRGVSRGGTIGRSPMARVVQPAEWARHKAVWIGFPSHAELWRDDLMPAREEVIAFARAVHADGKGETVLLVAADDEAAAAARKAAPFAEVVVEPFGDKIGRAHSELQSLMRISYAVFCLQKKKTSNRTTIQSD